MTDHARKDKRPFVPPPWERDQFEELERRRAEREIDRLMDEVPPPGQPSGEPSAAPSEPGVPAGEGVASDAGQPAERDRSLAPEPAGPKPAEIETMLFGLKAQEPDSLQGVYWIGIGTAVLLAGVGIAMFGWGIVAMVRTLRAGPGAAMGAGVVLVMGLVFVVGAGLLTARTLRQRGDS